jgi:hypothetical protein
MILKLMCIWLVFIQFYRALKRLPRAVVTSKFRQWQHLMQEKHQKREMQHREILCNNKYIKINF